MSLEFNSRWIVSVLAIQEVNGNIIGGGSGYAGGPLSLGAREAFDVNGPFSAIPSANAAQGLVSVIPNYRRIF